MKILLPIIDFSSIFFLIQWSVILFLGRNKRYKSLSKKNKLQLENRVVSTFHSIFAPIHTVKALCYEGFSNSVQPMEVSSYTKYSMHFSLGYFLWDLVASIKEGDPSFIIHAIACLGVFIMGLLDPSITIVVLSFLLYEVSTPFVNIRWFLLKYDAKRFKTWISRLEKIIFCLFTGVRIVMGLPVQLYFLHKFWNSFTQTPTVSNAVMIMGNAGLGGLNVFWAGKMIYTFLQK